MTTAFVFPGQGSQSVGMGHDLYEAAPAARAIFDQADAILGLPLTRLSFDGPKEALTATENAQPALLTVSAALLAALSDRPADQQISTHETRDRRQSTNLRSSVSPSFVAGHSLGEYSALLAAGALDFPTALRLVRRRGELMADAHEGTMAAIIGVDEQALEQVCRDASADGAPVVIANYNAPGQLVISGATSAVERADLLARARGAKHVMPLRVSAAFHSPLMRDAAEGLAAAVAAAAVGHAQVPVISHVSAEPLTTAEAIRRELVTQVTAPVRWIASIQRMVAEGVDTFVEIGPGSVLTKLIKRIAPSARLVNVSDAAGIHIFGSYEL
jgi:[acyl-carrier-protein] S-malonyltransferase